jgi:hypothetical protein
MSRARTVALVLVLFAAFVLLELLVGTRTAPPSPDRDHSSRNPNRWGTEALQDTLTRLGLTTEQSGAPFRADFLRPGDALLVLDPQLLPSPREYAALWEAVRRGATVIIAVSGERRELPLELAGSPEAARWDPPAATDLTLAYLGLSVRAAGEAGRLQVPPARQAGVLAGVQAVEIPSAERLRPGADADRLRQEAGAAWGSAPLPRPLPGLSPPGALLQDPAGGVLLHFSLGRGVVYVLSEVEIFSNEHLDQADNAVLAVNLVTAERPGGHERASVLFDEYHHGWLQPAALPGELHYAAFAGSLWLAVLALVVFLSGYGWRLGRPAPPVVPLRRSALEYVRAIASLYQAASAGGLAVSLAAGDFRRRLAASLRLPAHAADDLLVQVASVRGPSGARLADLLRRLDAVSEEARLSDAEVTRLFREISDMEESLALSHAGPP